MNDSSEQDLQKIAYELSLRAFGQQETALDELRRRTATLVAASSLTASFFGAQALATGGLQLFGTLALS